MHTSTPEKLADGTIVVEADTIESAMAAVEGLAGPQPEVLEVERIPRGGIGGFFAKEMVRVRVAPRPGSQPPADGIVEARPAGVDAMLATLAAAEDERESSFGEVLRRQLGSSAEAPASAAAPRELPASLVERMRAWSPDAGDAAPASAPTGSAAAAPMPAPSPAAPVDAAPAVASDVVMPKVSAATVMDHANATTTSDSASSMAEVLLAAMDRDAAARAASVLPRPSPAEENVVDDLVIVDEPSVDEHVVEPDVTAIVEEDVEAPVEDEASAPTTMWPAPIATSPTSWAPGDADIDGPVRSSGIVWSVDALQWLGLPSQILDAVAGLHTDNEFAWLQALARAVAPWCRPLPGAAAVLVGPKAHRISDGLGLEGVKRDELPPYGGTVGLKMKDDARSRTWMSEVRGERWLHLVIGGAGWERLLEEQPLAVSWVADEMLPEALGLCAQFGMVLGFGVAEARNAPVVRANPLDVALTIRSLLPRT